MMLGSGRLIVFFLDDRLAAKRIYQSGLTVGVTATESGGFVDKKASPRSKEVALQCVEVGGWMGPAVFELRSLPLC